MLSVSGVAGFVAAERKDRLRIWARDIKRWGVLPKAERERLVAAGLRYCAVLANERPVAAPAPPKPRAALVPATRREGSLALGTPLLGLPGVGPATAQKLAERELATVGDVLHFLPRRWDDLRAAGAVARARRRADGGHARDGEEGARRLRPRAAHPRGHVRRRRRRRARRRAGSTSAAA